MVEQCSSAQTNSSRGNVRKAVTMWTQMSVRYQITVSLPKRQYLSLHRVTSLSGDNQLPFLVGSFTILTFQRPAFAHTKACRKTPLTQQLFYCILKTCCITSALFSTNSHLFHNVIFYQFKIILFPQKMYTPTRGG